MIIDMIDDDREKSDEKSDNFYAPKPNMRSDLIYMLHGTNGVYQNQS